MARFSILAISSDDRSLPRIVAALEDRGHAVRSATTGTEALAVADGKQDLVMLHLPVEDMDGAGLIERLRGRAASTPIVVSGSDRSVRGAFDALERGAEEYLPDPLADTTRLLSVIGVALGARQSDRHMRYLRWRDLAGDELPPLQGDSASMGRLRERFRSVLQADVPAILVTGEPGVGKGVLARCVHYHGARRASPFIAVPCERIAEGQVAAELFGSERGERNVALPRAGLVGAAEGGTLFLDGAGALPPKEQEAVGRMIAERRLVRADGSAAVPVDVQVIASFHHAARESLRGPLVDALRGPLAAPHLHMPPLRERGGDAVALAEQLLTRIAGLHDGRLRHLAPSACEAILAHDWPGNVRELRNALERAVLLGVGEVRAEHLSPPPARLEVDGMAGHLEVRLPEQSFSLTDLEREVLRVVLGRSRGNVTRAARFLGISRQTLIYRIKKYDLSEFVRRQAGRPHRSSRSAR